MASRDTTVTCYCAAWCDVCSEYRDGFLDLGKRFPHAAFRWVDIEDDPPEFDVENFPTIEVTRAGRQLFLGPQPPSHPILERLLKELLR